MSSFNLFLADSEAGFKDADEGDQLQGARSRDGIKGSKATLDGGEGNSRGDVYGGRRFKLQAQIVLLYRHLSPYGFLTPAVVTRCPRIAS